MAGLQLGSNYLNSYEVAHKLLQTTPYFRQDDWQEFAKRGELDNYIGVLSRADELPSFDQFAEENRFDLLDADKRYTYMANELLGDKNNIVERTLTKYNDDGTITEYKQNMSDYDYTKYLLNQYKDYKIAEENRQIEQERKDDMNGFVKFLASVAGTAGEFTKGALDLVSGVVSIAAAPIGGIVTAAQGDGFNKGEREVLGGALDISDNIGLTEALDKFERENTFLKDLDGNLTSFGKIFSQTAYSFGQILIPGVVGKALSAAGVSANIAGKISTGIYYTGMTGNNIKDMINDPSMATVPTWEIVFNAAAKSAVEYAIQVGVSKIFGTSTIDKLIGIGGSSTRGIFGKLSISARGGLARIGLEFVNEGVEEMLQQFSNVLVDDFFSIFEQNFGQLSDWNFQTMFDAFVLGGIGGAFAGSFRMMTMRRTPDIKQRYSEKSGFKVYNWFKSKLANYEYINRYSDVAQLYDNIMNDSKMTSEERIVATEQMYSAMRVFGAYYNQIGEQRMQAAEQMLTTMKQYSRSLYDDSKNIKKAATQIFAQLGNMRIDEQNAIIEKMKAAAMTGVDNIVTRDNIDTIDDQDLLNKTKQYFNDNPDADYIVYTRDGKNVISFKNATFVPIEYMKNLDSNSVLKNQAEQTVVDAIQNAKGLNVALDEIYTIFKKVTGREDVTNQEIVYNLLFNESFQRILLTTANREVYRVLAHLKDIVNNATRKTVKDAIFKERMQQTYDALAKNLVDYLINQQTAYYDNLSILTKEQKAYIKNQRYSKDLANRVRNNEKLSQADYSVLENRVNSMPATDEVRQQVIENLHSNEQTARNNAMNVIERYYRNVFNSPYDNKTYLELSSQGNAIFDEFLRNLGKTLDTLLDVKANSTDAQIITELYNEVNRQTIIRYYRDQFAEFTNGNYDFTISKGQFVIHENESVRQQGFDNFIEQHKQIRGNYANIKGRTFTDIRQNAASKYLNTVISKNIDVGTRSTLDVRDLVYNSDYLTKKAKQEIEEQYGSITPINTFLYLRNRFLNESGNTVSIIVTPEYDFVVVDVKPMIQMFKDEEFKVQTKNEVSISDYIKSEYLTGRLADTKVRLGDTNEYNPTSNIITVKKDTPAKVRVAIAHEFQHAIQVANNLNGGLDYNWLSNMTKRQQRAIINDIRRHRPELFETTVEGKKQNITRGSELEFEIARNFIYDSTGESQAYGAEGRDIVDYYPIITRRQGDSVSLITPWGSIYNVNGNMSQAPEYDKLVNEYAKRTYNAQMTPNSLTGFIFPDGYVGFSETMWTHEQFYQDLAKQFGARADLFKDNLVEIALNTNRFSGAYVDSMTIRVNGKLNADQRTALYDFVSDALANDAQIEIEDIPSGRYAGSEPGDYNARRLLARAGISIGGGSMSMAQPGDKRTRRIKADVWKDTNLKYFNKRQGVDPRIQDLVINLDPAQTEPDLWEFIGGNRKGELNMWTLQEYIRNASRMNDYTFNKINQYVYQNDNIKTFNELQRLVDSFDIYFALSVAIRSIKNTNKLDLLNRKISYKNARKLYDQVATDPRTEKAVSKAVGYFDAYIDTRTGKAKYIPIEIDREGARITMLKHYDGTINSVVNVAMRTKAAAILYNEHPYYRQRSGRGQTVSADEQIDESRSRIDFIADDSAQNAFNEVIYGYTREQMIDKILDYTIEQAAMRGQIIKNTDALRAAIERHSTDTIENMFVELDLADDMGIKVNDDMVALTPDENAQEQVAKNINKNSILKRPSSYKQSIIQFARTIRNRLSLREFKKLPEDVQQMFDKNGMLKPESYQNKSREELIQLREFMREIATKAKRGEFEVKSDELLHKEIKQLQKENKQLDKEIKNRPIVEKTINLANHEFTINSDAEMPNVLRQMINTSFETFADTDVKYLTGSDEKHLKLSLNEFTNKNAMRLSGLTSGDAEAIIDYFNNAIVISNEQSLKIFNAVKMYTLAAVYDLARQGQFVLSSDYITRIKEIMRAAGSQAGTDLAVFRNVIETFNPSKQIIQSMARSNGIEFDEQLVDDMVDALSKNDIAKARVIKEQMYQDVLAKAKKGKVRRTIWDKLIAFERMAMLSSPGTWVRNITSNYTVTFMNEIGGKLGKLFTSKFKKNVQGQYQITGTKTTQEVYDFIKTNVEDSGLFALIKEGLNKWDPRVTAQKSKTASQLTQMIMSTVENEVFSHSFNESKGIKNTGYLLETFMSKVLSDNRWIDKRFKSYLGKMLTEDIKNGTVLAQKPTSENKLKPIDLSNGLTPDIMNIVADAYKLAAYDYMHRFNTFSKIDATIRERGGNAVYFLWKQIMPFAAASWNWFIEGLSYTPIGLAKSIVDFARMEKTIDKLDYQRRKGDDVISSSFVRYLAQRNIGKGAIGTIGFLIGMMLGGFGVAEVDEEDEKVKLHIGDIWLDITNLTGTQGILLGMMVMNPSKGDAWDAIVQVADTLANDSTLESLFNLFRYSNSVGEFVVSYPMTIAGMFVPNALKAFNALIQPNKIKYSQGFKGDLEYFAQSLIPGFSYTLNMRTDPFTGETQTKFNVPFIIDFLNRMTPIKLYNYRVSELEKKVLELQAQSGKSLTTNELTGKYSDIGQLSGEDVVKLNQKYGELNNKILTQFFNNKIVVRVQNEDGTFSELRYNQMTDEQRANAYNSLMSKNATYAKIYIWTQAGNKYYATNEMFDILRELGIRQNVYREVGKKTGFVK